jgi:hypothetical protein
MLDWSQVDDRITNKVLPQFVSPSIIVPLPYPASFNNRPILPESTDNLVADPNNPPFGSMEVSNELEVAEKFSNKLFSR